VAPTNLGGCRGFPLTTRSRIHPPMQFNSLHRRRWLTSQRSHPNLSKDSGGRRSRVTNEAIRLQTTCTMRSVTGLPAFRTETWRLGGRSGVVRRGSSVSVPEDPRPHTKRGLFFPGGACTQLEGSTKTIYDTALRPRPEERDERIPPSFTAPGWVSGSKFRSATPRKP